ncbi:hypothetical protein C8R44DRAFT_732285 [Mycena epipterygia]|nr:hypothetical protein C8R44DRAFT_732285 [Mycena epipterygia]
MPTESDLETAVALATANVQGAEKAAALLALDMVITTKPRPRCSLLIPAAPLNLAQDLCISLLRTCIVKYFCVFTQAGDFMAPFKFKPLISFTFAPYLNCSGLVACQPTHSSPESRAEDVRKRRTRWRTSRRETSEGGLLVEAWAEVRGLTAGGHPEFAVPGALVILRIN